MGLRRIRQRESNLIIYSLDWQQLKRPGTSCAGEKAGEQALLYVEVGVSTADAAREETLWQCLLKFTVCTRASAAPFWAIIQVDIKALVQP